ncbi:MAG: VanZ family protein [Clostridia bacterium]|nr:VanZ family protein [Clostridia bacterium]
MQKNNQKPNVAMAVVMGIFCLFCMVMIFLFSYQSADVSSGESLSLYTTFVEMCGGKELISHNVFRKLAHFSEYTAFSFSFFGFLYSIKRCYCVWSSFAFCVLYSMSDEVHQFFVPERACRPFDVFVDSLGIIFGMSVFFVLDYFFSTVIFAKRHNT